MILTTYLTQIDFIHESGIAILMGALASLIMHAVITLINIEINYFLDKL
jgi:hypothetical protein